MTTASRDRPRLLIARYDLQRFNFRAWAEAVLGVSELEQLHRKPDPKKFSNYVDRLGYYTELLKTHFGEMLKGYLEFANTVVSPIVGSLQGIQTPPSFRCHLSGAGTVSAFHRDGDAKYNLRPWVLNVWLPLTITEGNNSIYIESVMGSEEYEPVSLKPGEFLIFDAFHLAHGSRPNDTQTTRVSFDFRFVPNDLPRARDLGLYASEEVVRGVPVNA